MKNKNRNINLYTQGQRLAARVLFIVGLLVSFGLGKVLAAPGGPASAPSVSTPVGASEAAAGPVAEGGTEDKINAIVDRNALNPGDLDDLLEATKNNDCNVREAAFEALRKIGAQLQGKQLTEVLKALQTATKDKDKDVRQAAVKALRKIGAQLQGKQLTEVLKALQEAIEDSDEDVCNVALEALNKAWLSINDRFIQDSQAVKEEDLATLDTIIQGTTPKTVNDSEQSIWLLEEFVNTLEDQSKRAEALTALIAAAEVQNNHIRRVAVEALGKIGAQLQGDELNKVLEALQTATKDKDKGVRKAAVGALGEFAKLATLGDKCETVLKALQQKVLKEHEEAWQVRKAAIEALGNFGDKSPATLQVLYNATEDPNQWVRTEAIRALGQLGDQSQATLQVLYNATEDPNQWVRTEAVNALWKCGANNLQSLDVILSKLRDENANVR